MSSSAKRLVQSLRGRSGGGRGNGGGRSDAGGGEGSGGGGGGASTSATRLCPSDNSLELNQISVVGDTIATTPCHCGALKYGTRGQALFSIADWVPDAPAYRLHSGECHFKSFFREFVSETLDHLIVNTGTTEQK